jgi:hypothetical protein
VTHFTFDVPSGTFKSPELCVDLTLRANRPGPILPIYAAVRFSSLDSFNDPSCDARAVLTYQLRFLRSLYPNVRPELRVMMPLDFGRTKTVVWYAPEYEQLIEEGVAFNVIDPEEVL